MLVSNSNDQANVQGTGTTIVQLTPGGHRTLFAHINPELRGCPRGVGLTTALVVLRIGAGNLSGLAVRPGFDAVHFADDTSNTFNPFS